ncbi:MAG: F0F1 ATP synthase subunit A [Planctomycetes bacterium]|nr:F0F1 ATP synthase subunit A [Planctomycetota bacterium]
MASPAGADPIAAVFNHINDHVVRFGPGGRFAISGHIVMSWIVSALVLGVFVWLAKRMASRKGMAPEGTFDNLFESFILFIRDEVIVANMGHHGHAHAPFLLTTFFFILFSNLLGLVPGGRTCTGNFGVTLGLAIVVFTYGVFHGMRAQGVGHYLKNLAPAGVPVFILPILYPIEILGLFIKHGVLAVRLFANMVAGHMVIGIILALPKLLGIQVVSVPAYAVASGIMFLELFVAFLQAYVFTMLASLFLGAAVHPEH